MMKKSAREKALNTKDNNTRVQKIQRKTVGLQQKMDDIITRLEALEQGNG